MNNVVDFHQLNTEDDKDTQEWEDFCDSLKTDVFKGAFFIVKKDGKVSFGCTELKKVQQERMLYHLKRTIEQYISITPDYEELEEFDEMLKKEGKPPIREELEPLFPDLDEEY